jgi:DinB family protein
MNAELESDSDQLLSIRQDGLGLMSGLSDAQFNWQPGPGRWSMAGCFDHLNKSAAHLFIRNIDAAIATATAQGLKSNGPFAYSLLERWAVRSSDAPVKTRFKAPKNVRPAASLRLDDVRVEFVRWQDEIGRRLRQADGLDLRRAKYTWPFWPLKWSLGASFQLILAHERRHIWQARQVRQSPGFPS